MNVYIIIASQYWQLKAFLWVNVHSEVGYNSVCWNQERIFCTIFSQISQILAVTGAWCVNEFCMWHLFKSILSVKINENSAIAFSGLRPMWIGSRFVQADPVLIHPNGCLAEHSQGLLCHCGGRGMGRSRVVWGAKVDFWWNTNSPSGIRMN